ncbi:MAG: trypsin-like peptidase domain-containing protein [Planctomycetota bacterium]
MMMRLLVATLCLFVGFSRSLGQDDPRRTAAVDVLQQVQPAVAVVFAFDEKGKRLGSGSGSVIDPRGYVLTAKHVVGKNHIVLLGGRAPVTARLVGTMPEFDVAILKLGGAAFNRPGAPVFPRDTLPPDFLRLGVDQELKMGETIFNVGSPGGRGIVASQGIVSAVAFTGINPLSIALQSSMSSDELIQFDAASNPGNSGGPLINLLGQQVGMTISGIHSEEGIHFAVPTNTIRHSIFEILCSELRLGFQSGILIDEQANHVRVLSIDQSSPAFDAGLKTGDQILSVNGKPLRDPIDWAFSQNDWKPRQTLSMQVLRGQETLNVNLVLATRVPTPAIKITNVQPGVTWRSATYDPRIPAPLGQIRRPAHSAGIVATVKALPDDASKKGLPRQDHYVLWLDGYLNIDTPGRYRLGLKSDDGSRLYVHDKLVIDNNGNHAPILRTGWVNLDEGLHPFRIDFYEDEGNQVLELLIAQGDKELQPITADLLFCDAAASGEP